MFCFEIEKNFNATKDLQFSMFCFETEEYFNASKQNKTFAGLVARIKRILKIYHWQLGICIPYLYHCKEEITKQMKELLT